MERLLITPNDLLEGVGAGAPPGEEHGETDGLEDLGSQTDGDGVEGTSLSEDLGEKLVKCQN